MALTRKWIPSPHYSSRGGTAVRLLVIHTAEGALTIESLGSWFQNPSANVSSQTGIDDKPNTVGEFVTRSNKAWTQGNCNPYCVSTELCAFAKWPLAEWDKHPVMLENCAKWLAEESAALGIPLVRLNQSQALGGGKGVCMHVDLGSTGGGHWDCGTGFPIDRVISMAGGQSAPTPPAQAPSAPAGGPAPPLHVDYFGPAYGHNHTCPDVAIWQQRMSDRGWSIDIDQIYGEGSESVCREFQAEKGLAVDGMVGPQTWGAAWTAPVT
jgi:peptidoglycan hydrolase-like protein with peptidoglycan-binding domain